MFLKLLISLLALAIVSEADSTLPLNQAFYELTQQIKTLEWKLDFLGNSLPQLAEKIDGLEVKLNQLNASLVSNVKDLDTKIAQIYSNLDNKISRLNTTIDSKIDFVNENLESVQNQLNASLISNAFVFDTKLFQTSSNLDTKLNRLNSTFESKINVLTTNLEQKSSQLNSSLLSNVKNLETQAIQINSNLDSKISQLSSSLVSNYKDLNGRIDIVSAANANDINKIAQGRIIYNREPGFEFPLNLNNPADKINERRKKQRINFGFNFKKVPNVFLSVNLWDYKSDTNTIYHIYPENVSTSGFDLVVYTWYNSIVHEVLVEWLAIGQI